MERTYQQAMAATGMVELPAVARATAPAPAEPCETYHQVLDDLDRELFRGRWEDDNPPGSPA